MNDRERLKDARLDRNLDDVQHDPAPWDTAALALEAQNNFPSRP